MKSQSEQRILSDPIARLLSTPLAPAECIVSLHRVHCQSAPGAPLHRRQYHRRTRVDDPLHLRLQCPKANTDPPAVGTSSNRPICGPCVGLHVFWPGLRVVVVAAGIIAVSISFSLQSASPVSLPAQSASCRQTHRRRCLRLYRCRWHRYCCRRRSWRQHLRRRLRHRQHRADQIYRRRRRLRLRRHRQRRRHRCRLDRIRRRH